MRKYIIIEDLVEFLEDWEAIALMGYVRLRIRELAEQKGWTFKEVADRSGVNYNTVRSYVQRDTLNTVDLSAVYKIARAFDVTMEDLVEILEDWRAH
jgi:putative transcriptional regulator